MALTFNNLLTELAGAEGKTLDATAAGGTSEVAEETMRFQYVLQANGALRWVLSEYDQEWIWPEWCADNATVTVTNGIVQLTDLIDTVVPAQPASACSLWTADPRVSRSGARKVYGYVSTDGVHLQDYTAATVFAFYRKAVPQGAWSAASNYATPNDIPNQLRMPITLKAEAMRLWSKGEHAAAGTCEKRAKEWMEDRKVGLLNSNAVAWAGHVLVL